MNYLWNEWKWIFSVYLVNTRHSLYMWTEYFNTFFRQFNSFPSQIHTEEADAQHFSHSVDIDRHPTTIQSNCQYRLWPLKWIKYELKDVSLRSNAGITYVSWETVGEFEFYATPSIIKGFPSDPLNSLWCK